MVADTSVAQKWIVWNAYARGLQTPIEVARETGIKRSVVHARTLDLRDWGMLRCTGAPATRIGTRGRVGRCWRAVTGGSPPVKAKTPRAQRWRRDTWAEYREIWRAYRDHGPTTISDVATRVGMAEIRVRWRTERLFEGGALARERNPRHPDQWLYTATEA